MRITSANASMEEKYTHLFNPQNDLALANGSPNFTAPKSAIELADAGACLPIWYANPGDTFIGAVNRQWFEGVRKAFGLAVYPTMSPVADSLPRPWGWSPQVRRYLFDLGYNEDLLPSKDNIDSWRNLSSRVNSATLITEFLRKTGINDETAIPFISSDVEDALNHIKKVGTCIIKLPWSSSGRGQQISDRTTPEELERRIAGMITHQGAVEITPFYDKLTDFAMLWDHDKFIGYSFFQTDTHGGWTNNILFSDAEIEQRISAMTEQKCDLKGHVRIMEKIVREIAHSHDYKGPIGVDFIVACRGAGTPFIVPVEVNWRRTMGHVSHALLSRYMTEDVFGTFAVYRTEAITEDFHFVDGCVIEDGKILSGSLDLVPPGGAFRFILDVMKEKII